MSNAPLPRILIIEDEPAMRTALQFALESEGYRVISAADGPSGLTRALEEKPDLILLDIMLPKLDGFTLCAELRHLGRKTPVLMLTAKAQVEERVAGLDCGADDYLVKPFSTEELLARIRALFRRAARNAKPPALLEFGDVRIDFPGQTVRRGSQPVHLTAKEFAMLQLMAEAPGEVISRERFLDLVWGYSAFPTTRTVDNHIVSLRGKLEPDPANPRFIQTVRGAGYRLNLG